MAPSSQARQSIRHMPGVRLPWGTSWQCRAVQGHYSVPKVVAASGAKRLACVLTEYRQKVKRCPKLIFPSWRGRWSATVVAQPTEDGVLVGTGVSLAANRFCLKL